MLRIQGISLSASSDGKKQLVQAAQRALGVKKGGIVQLKIKKRSVDARKKDKLLLKLVFF